MEFWIISPIVLIFLAMGLKVVQEYERGVIFFLGRCTGVRGPGLIILIPLFERMQKVTLRTITMDIPSQKIITKDTSDINDQIRKVIDKHTEPWGAQVTAVEIKDIVLPDNMQRAMAKEAEVERERRAKIVAAEGEKQAAESLGKAADIISKHPVALQLRTLQTMAEISTEKNSTIIFPAQFMTTVQEAIKTLARNSSRK